MEKNIKKSNAKVIMDFNLNLTAVRNGQTVRNEHMDGKFSMEIDEVKEFIRASVSSALKGVADSLEEKSDIENEFSPERFQD